MKELIIIITVGLFGSLFTLVVLCGLEYIFNVSVGVFMRGWFSCMGLYTAKELYKFFNQ